MTDSIIPSIVTTIASALPSIIALIRENHAAAHPGAPPLTDADVFAALHDAVGAVVRTGEQWKASHLQSEPNSPGD